MTKKKKRSPRRRIQLLAIMIAALILIVSGVSMYMTNIERQQDVQATRTSMYEMNATIEGYLTQTQAAETPVPTQPAMVTAEATP
ncbi:MAG: hypothetical protein H6670_01130 [Anaerolineaceae bacterium]|nr:hypothetical protein [Anaerolineaceae bacterium]